MSMLINREADVQGWQSIHNSLSKAIRRAAKVALGKDVTKVQNYIMSGKYQSLCDLLGIQF